MTELYTHRNGETTAPTVRGLYWFNGIWCSVAIPAAMVYVLDDGNAIGWYLMGETLRALFGKLPEFDGRWWGPVVAPGLDRHPVAGTVMGSHWNAIRQDMAAMGIPVEK